LNVARDGVAFIRSQLPFAGPRPRSTQQELEFPMRATTALAACTLAGAMALSHSASAQTGAPFTPPILAAGQPRVAVPAAKTLAATTVRAAQVQIADDEAHAPYQEGNVTNCTFAGACTVAFSTVPAGHRRTVEHMSCSVYLPSPGTLRYVALLANSFSFPRDFFAFTRSPADPAQSFVNSPTLLHFEAGEAPLAYAFADGQAIQEIFCTVSGRDIVLP
jgi:hypothetical protein